jgi:hypothetical protein
MRISSVRTVCVPSQTIITSLTSKKRYRLRRPDKRVRVPSGGLQCMPLSRHFLLWWHYVNSNVQRQLEFPAFVILQASRAGMSGFTGSRLGTGDSQRMSVQLGCNALQFGDSATLRRNTTPSFSRSEQTCLLWILVCLILWPPKMEEICFSESSCCNHTIR